MPDQRLNQLAIWLKQQFPASEPPTMISGDASFRRYFRFFDQGRNLIAVDAPPEKEALNPFLAVTKLLQKHAIQTPTIITHNLESGFLVLTDLGDTLLFETLERTKEPYSNALEVLGKIQTIAALDDLPLYSEILLRKEMSLFDEWFLKAHLKLEISSHDSAKISKAKDLLCKTALAQKPVFVHRDYHSRNIMVGEKDLFLIDYQDAVIGPYTYDLVSLLKDCYCRWPNQLVEAWALSFWQNQRERLTQLPDDANTFLRDFHLMGLQRHLKVLGIFCRLAIRDDKKQYLDDLPRVLGYVLETLQAYPEFELLHEFFALKIVPLLKPDYQEMRLPA